MLGPLRKATERLNPQAPREEAVYQNQNLGIPARLAGNRTFHALLLTRIPRKYRYLPDKQEEVVQLVLQQAETVLAEWA